MHACAQPMATLYPYALLLTHWTGYKAQGDTAALLRLGPQYGLKVQIADIVEDRREAAAENGIPSTITNSLSADKSVMSNVMDTAGASSSLSNSGFDLGLSSSEAGPPSKPGISGAGSALQLCSSFECDTEGTRISSSRVRGHAA